MTAEQFDRELAVNVRGAFLCSKAAIRHYKATGRRGVILSASSVHERIPKPGYLAYAASKGALGNITKTLALEFASYGIRVNAVAPGATITPFNRNWAENPDRRSEEAQTAPAVRLPIHQVLKAFQGVQSWIDSGMCDLEIDNWHIGIEMSAKTTTEIRDAIRSVFRGKPVKQVDIFGSAARGEIAPDSDVDLLVTPSYEATRHDLFTMAAEVEDALGRRIDFLIRSDVEAMKDVEAKNLILKNAVTVYVP